MSARTGVLFIQSQVAFGADSLIHAEIMRHLDRSRFDVHVACTAGDGTYVPKSLAALREIPDLNLRVTHFAPGLSQRTPAAVYAGIKGSLAFPRDMLALVDYTRRAGISVIHGTEKPRDASYATLLGKLSGASSVVHVHVKWSNEYSWAARQAVRHATAAFSISEYVTDTLVAMGKPRSEIFTILNALDASAWDPNVDGSGIRREFAVGDGEPLLASVSRLFSWKGQRELVRALALVKREVPNVKLLIVGEDERYVHGGSFTAELTELARELGVLDNVVFTGARRDVAQIMAACDIYTMPSFEEPFGVVFLEAMAMARPVVAIANGGTPEVVGHERAGLLSPPWEIEPLARNILRLIRDPELRLRMGAYGRSRVLDYFNPRRMADEAGRAYEVLAARKPTRRG